MYLFGTINHKNFVLDLKQTILLTTTLSKYVIIYLLLYLLQKKKFNYHLF